MRRYFCILGIPEDASEADIRKAYRELAKKYHPDINKAKDAHEKFIEITEAYEFLMGHRRSDTVIVKDQSAGPSNHGADNVWYYERLKQQARERAQQHAKAKYEEFKKQHEAFRQSGLEDAGLLLTIIFRAGLLVLFLFLLTIPFVMALRENPKWLFFIFVSWPFAGIIGWFVYDKRRGYFMPGTFYYNFPRIIRLYTEVHPTSFNCYYCPSHNADSKSYAVELLRLKGLKLGTGGFRQHTVNYINRNVKILVPRSRKAFLAHSIVSFVKLATMVCSMIFLDVSSILWRFIIGMSVAGLLGSLVLFITGTKSNVSYLISAGSILRVALWLTAILMVTDFSLNPFNINTNDGVQFVVVSIMLFDCVLMQGANLILGNKSCMPLIRQFETVDQKFKEGFRVYNDVSIISVVYPIIKWIFG